MVTWSAPLNPLSKSPEQTDWLMFAEDVIRYKKFVSPFSIKFCLQESLPYLIDNKRVVVNSDSFMVVNDGLEMECLPCNPGVRAFAVYFTNELLHDIYRNGCSNERNLLDAPGSSAAPVHFFQHIYRQPNLLSGQMRLLAQLMADSEIPHHILSPNIFYSLAENLFSLQRDTSRQIAQVNARTSSTREELFRRVLHAREWMHDHWNSELRLEQIARAACLSPYHFHRSFREAFGLSPMKWLRRLKMQKAKAMLETGGTNVTRVAYDCGFADVFSFSKAFKRELGVSPSAVIAE